MTARQTQAPIAATRSIRAIERRESSVNGNPRFRIAFTDGSSVLTMSDAGFCYAIAYAATLPSAPRRAFYVTIRRGSRTGFLLGPYERYDDALANVERGRRLAYAADPFSGFDAFGTARAPIRKAVFGR